MNDPASIPTVSVIIPVYNSESFLHQCLDSILAQDINSLEIIAVNDGSTDNSLAILEQYRERNGIVVVDQQNSGPSHARNVALSMAHGEYVGFVDADDWIEPTMYSTMVSVANHEDADIVFCNLYRNRDERMRKYLPSGVYRNHRIIDSIYPLLICNTQEREGKVTLRGATWCRLFRRELLSINGIKFDEDLIYNEDALFCIEATLASQCYVYLGEEYLYHNRYVPGSLTKRYIPCLWERQRKMIGRLKDLVITSTYDFSSQIAKKLMDIAIYCVENECKPDNKASRRQVEDRVRAIICDDELQGSLKQISLHSLKRINKGYWWAIRLRSPRLAVGIARHRQNKHIQNRRLS